MMRFVVLTLTAACISLPVSAQAPDGAPWPCRSQPVESCVKHHGRLSSQNGIALRIWLIGTTRVVGLANDIDELPVQIRKYLDMTSPDHSYIYGDFDICPLGQDEPGHMRRVCVTGAEKLVIQNLQGSRPAFRLLSTWPAAAGAWDGAVIRGATLKELAPEGGYSIHPHVFERKEMARILDRLAAAEMDRTKAGARHVLKVPAVRALAEDRRLLTIASQFVGAGPVLFRATLFDQSPGANWLVVWHQDTALPLDRRIDAAGWGPWSTKSGVLYAHAAAWALESVVALRVSLDDSTRANGPLRVLPGTHLNGVLSDDEIEQAARDLIPAECVTPSGGVVAMRPLTVHASSKSTDDRPRRVLHIEYAAAVDLGSGVELAVG